MIFQHLGRPQTLYFCLLSCATVLLLLITITAIQLGLDTAEPSNRMIFHAAPMAVSVLEHDWNLDYTAIQQVAMHMQVSTNGNLTTKILTTSGDDFQITNQPYFWIADDRGLGLYTIFAGAIFGLSLQGLFNFHISLLAVTVIAFMIGNSKKPLNLLLLVSLLIAYQTALFLMAAAGKEKYFAEASVHISESRYFDLLALFPITHILLAAFNENKLNLSSKLSFLVQCILFAFLLHCRSTIKWEVLAALLAILLILFLRLKHKQPITAQIFKCPLVLCACIFVFLPIYEKFTFHSKYFSENGGERTIWHNMVIGMSDHMFFREKFGFKGDDYSAARAVIDFYLPQPQELFDPTLSNVKKLAASKVRDKVVDETARAAMNALGSHTNYNWAGHETYARKFLLDTAIKYPKAVIELYAIVKPTLIWANLKKNLLTGLNRVKNLNPALQLTSVILPSLFLIFLILNIAAAMKKNNLRLNFKFIYGYSGIFLFFSTIPSYFFYASSMTVAPFFMLLFTVLIVFIIDLCSNTLKRVV